ncbi:hypothetical protein Tsubulata_005043 [Turnera subulata]|uniref:non-specific serine/threonine protein kinase n=1 Tax=Turnera subulata TaxID=218843 RepID=A0A9Q0J5B9_9ROSI|nr:hypothetical protein Tsubulata_005043 [Turnera subulata]
MRPVAAASIFLVLAFLMALKYMISEYLRRIRGKNSDSTFTTLTIDEFLDGIEREKPIRFSAEQLILATGNFASLLGTGGFGAVYKGMFSDGTPVAVKVLHGSSDKKIEEQFMAEVGTIGRVHHFNLVRLYGFCFERNMRALVYEYMSNGSLDRFLFHDNKIIGFEKLCEIAVGTAKGLAYLHEECQQRIVHYDIKPGNILLDEKFFPKVADFGLAKLCNRDNTHITMTGGRGTPGYAAPELWMPYAITHKCDVYSFGMLLFEIIGRRRNLDTNLPEKDREVAERFMKAALWCVQSRPESRPLMSTVVKMLEGSMEIPSPLNPFPNLFEQTTGPEPPSHFLSNSSIFESTTVTGSKVEHSTPVMTKYEIHMATT